MLGVFVPQDPFADATKGDDKIPAGTEDKIHIRIQQRNGRKTLTTVQGIAHDYDKKKLVKAFKKVDSLLQANLELGPMSHLGLPVVNASYFSLELYLHKLTNVIP